MTEACHTGFLAASQVESFCHSPFTWAGFAKHSFQPPEPHPSRYVKLSPLTADRMWNEIISRSNGDLRNLDFVVLHYVTCPAYLEWRVAWTWKSIPLVGKCHRMSGQAFVAGERCDCVLEFGLWWRTATYPVVPITACGAILMHSDETSQEPLEQLVITISHFIHLLWEVGRGSPLQCLSINYQLPVYLGPRQHDMASAHELS